MDLKKADFEKELTQLDAAIEPSRQTCRSVLNKLDAFLKDHYDGTPDGAPRSAEATLQLIELLQVAPLPLEYLRFIQALLGIRGSHFGELETSHQPEAKGEAVKTCFISSSS